MCSQSAGVPVCRPRPALRPALHVVALSCHACAASMLVTAEPLLVSRPFPGAALPNRSCRAAVHSLYGIILCRQDLKKDGLNIVAILLPQTPECWDYRHEPIQPSSLESFFFLGDNFSIDEIDSPVFFCVVIPCVRKPVLVRM